MAISICQWQDSVPLVRCLPATILAEQKQLAVIPRKNHRMNQNNSQGYPKEESSSQRPKVPTNVPTQVPTKVPTITVRADLAAGIRLHNKHLLLPTGLCSCEECAQLVWQLPAAGKKSQPAEGAATAARAPRALAMLRLRHSSNIPEKWLMRCKDNDMQRPGGCPQQQQQQQLSDNRPQDLIGFLHRQENSRPEASPCSLLISMQRVSLDDTGSSQSTVSKHQGTTPAVHELKARCIDDTGSRWPHQHDNKIQIMHIIYMLICSAGSSSSSSSSTLPP